MEANYQYNFDAAEKLRARNGDLRTEYRTEKANYIEIKNNIPPENAETVQAQCTEIQADEIHRTRKELENIYKEKFDDDIFAEARKSVNNDLREKPLRKSLIQQIERGRAKQQKSIANKHKKYEFER